MPNFDNTGPAGLGSKTGGQLGKCADANPQNKPCDGRGKGMGKRQGCPKRGGQGQGRRFNQQDSNNV